MRFPTNRRAQPDIGEAHPQQNERCALNERLAKVGPRHPVNPLNQRHQREPPMSSSKFMLSCLCGLAVLLSPLRAPASPGNCRAPEIGTNRAPMVSPPLGAVVVGTGRLQFYSAPNPQCPILGTFVIPKDEVVVYAETNDGWSSVAYFGGKTANNVSGWVRSARLKTTGTMGPSQ